ncbi:diheme cytochrome c-553 [Rhodocytophaga rosea]|uniref:Diheme cytochrome c-553 n=1 Tax=Rhodocytophaga rosea TaxID=2704465 RepID=A0A6C0GKV8_9BACT|nr:diheme cytochrome c-553 [Rhodocytophaga rosea]QHT68648.1 diheme cytochrome c-553 [Rhodocytophaga rosea]
MNKTIINIALAIWTICTIISGMVACNNSKSESKAATELSEESEVSETTTNETMVKRGEYLVTIMGCHDCHSPKKFGPRGPEPDPDRLLSGHPQDMPIAKVDTAIVGPWVLFNAHTTATVGPWGASFAANITSDATGIGNWTEEQFFRALREGKYKGLPNNRMLLPPMPWPMFSKLEDNDLKAIFVYLKTVKPVKNIPPAPRPLSELSSLY